MPRTVDPGLTQKYDGALRRVINKDGSFNVRRVGVTLRNVHLYQALIDLPWPRFLGVVVLGYVLVNLAFAGVYLAIGIEELRGADTHSVGSSFLDAFFFSAHTFTTVGYGSISPAGILANAVAAFEALVGLLSLALATGLLYGRFARPSARIAYSDALLVTPYHGGTSIQFRIANQRMNMLHELHARVLLMSVERTGGQPRRMYFELPLELPRIHFFPLTWTIVHPIDEASPLSGKAPSDFEDMQAEFLVLITGFDDTFSQTVHSRYSYRYDEMVWGGRFIPAFHIDGSGDLKLDLRKIGEFEPVDLPVQGTAAPLRAE